MHRLSRRSFFGLAAGGLLVACGSGSDGDDGSGGTNGGSSPSAARSSGGDGRKAAALIAYFPDGIYLAGRQERLPFGLADAETVPLSASAPQQLEARLIGPNGQQLGVTSSPRRLEGLPRAYYAFDVNQPDPGVYTLELEVDGNDLQAMFTLGAAGSIGFPGAGEPLPAFDTPTTADPRGVTPLCTSPEPCPFHQVTLTEALAAAKPVAYLVGTPAHCQTGICGPILDLLVDAAPDFPEVTFVHAEVYADEAATKVAPAVSSLDLSFEPLLFLASADGVVRRRLDVIYDTDELRGALADLTS